MGGWEQGRAQVFLRRVAELEEAVASGVRSAALLKNAIEALEAAAESSAPQPAGAEGARVAEVAWLVHSIDEHDLALRVLDAMSKVFPDDAALARAMFEVEFGEEFEGFERLRDFGRDRGRCAELRLEAAKALARFGDVPAMAEVCRALMFEHSAVGDDFRAGLAAILLAAHTADPQARRFLLRERAVARA